MKSGKSLNIWKTEEMKMGWKILLPQEIMEEGRELLE